MTASAAAVGASLAAQTTLFAQPEATPTTAGADMTGTTHLTVLERANQLVSMTSNFLDEPMPDAG